MIISFRHQFIFTAIPKTATHGFRAALRPFLAQNDWEQCVLFKKKYFPIESLAEIGHGHISLREIKPFILPQMFEHYFKFCTVRIPFERFVSYCRFINRENQTMQTNALDTMKQIISDKNVHQEILFRPQIEFVTDEDENLAADYICRFENLQNDFDKICERLNLPLSNLKKINAGNSEKYREFYDVELKEMVRDFYRQDFEIFDYPLDLFKTNE